MPNLKALRMRINSVKSTQKIRRDEDGSRVEIAARAAAGRNGEAMHCDGRMLNTWRRRLLIRRMRRR